MRGGLLDLKQLQRVDEDGLEQWEPVLKAGFPVAAADVESVLAALAVEHALERAEYTLEQLLGELVEPAPELLRGRVHKRRRHVTVGGAMAELSELSTDRGVLRTIAVESEDPALVTAAVRELGLDLRPNVNVPRGLKELLALGRFAVVDVGTNSVKFVIGERREDGEWRTVVDRAEVTRLGEGLDRSGELSEEPIARTVDAITDMAEEAAREAVVTTAAVGTAGLRMARNSNAFVEAVRERTGIEVEIISGDEEARLAYLAVTSEHAARRRLARPLRHGRRELAVHLRPRREVEERFSVDVGAVRFTERFGLDGAVSEETLREAWPRSPPTSIASMDERRPTSSSGSAARSRISPRSSTGSSSTTQTSSAGRSSTAPRSTARSSSIARAPRMSGERSPASSRSAPRSSSPARAS